MDQVYHLRAKLRDAYLTVDLIKKELAVAEALAMENCNHAWFRSQEDGSPYEKVPFICSICGMER